MTKSFSILITTMMFWSAVAITSVCAFEMKVSDSIQASAADHPASVMEQWREQAR